MKIALAIFSVFIAVVQAATQTHDWTVGWKTVNPDGLKDREVVAINGEWPLPVLRVNKGDRLVITVHNNLTNPHRNSSIHFHGMFQNGTNDMDGPTWLTQCPGAPNTTFVYNFTVDQNGTYWYHTHVDGLYPDGYRQIMLVDDDKPWFEDSVDGEIFFTMSDWYHELTQDITYGTFLSLYNPTGAEPVPQSLLVNDTLAENIKYKVEPSKTYRLRIANTGAFSGYYFYIPGHNFTVVEADGVYTEPAEASSLYISAAQRYSILFNTTDDDDAVYELVQVADSSLYDVIPSDIQLNHTMWLYTGDEDKGEDRYKSINNVDIYNSGLVNKTDVKLDDYTSDDIEWFDDMTLVPYDHMELLPGPDVNHTLHLTMDNLNDGKNYAFFNDITWTHAKVPTLYSVLDAPDDETSLNSTIYGFNTNPIVLNHLDVVELVLNNDDDGKHPFHLHGHNFQAILRGDDYGEDYTPYDPDSDDNDPIPQYPMRRDVLVVLPNSHFVIRWRADNPGVWFFHCHIDWHLSQGLAVEFIEAPVQIRQNYKVHPILQSNVDTCRLSGLPYMGNAAGNTNFFDLEGENVQVKDLPAGFTARGIVALVFSCISAFLGMGSLITYGLTDTKIGEQHQAERILKEPVDGHEVEETEFQRLDDEISRENSIHSLSFRHH